jgi:hypothetical protein
MADYEPGERLKRWLKGNGAPTPVDARPISAWDYLTQQRLEALAGDVAEVKKLVLGLIAAVLTSALVSVVMGITK